MGDSAFVGEGAPGLEDGVATMMSLGVDAATPNGERWSTALAVDDLRAPYGIFQFTNLSIQSRPS